MELSIITATIPERAEKLACLSHDIAKQSRGMLVQHVVVDGDATVGEKIRQGLARSRGRYVCVVDDDDTIAPDYVKSLAIEIRHSPDVVTFGMQVPGQHISWLRANVEVDGGVADAEGNEIRLANHLCAWRREIALSAPCLPRNYGWDVPWYRSIRCKHPELTERHIHRVLYYYLYSPEGTRAQSPDSIAASMDPERNGGSKVVIVRLPCGALAAGSDLTRMYRPDGTEVNCFETLGAVIIKGVIFT